LTFFVETTTIRKPNPLHDSSDELSPTFLQTLTKRDMKLAGLKMAHQSFCVFQLRVLELATNETESGFLPTIDRNFQEIPKTKRLRMLLTPTASAYRGGAEHPEKTLARNAKYKNGTFWNNLQRQIAFGMLPTPRGRNPHDCKAERNRNTPYLTSLIAMLPTPAARDHKGTNSQAHLEQERGHHDQLPNALKMQTGLKLQPPFVAWMMGFPLDWTEEPFRKLE
jgi:hypothetical protein